MKNRAVARARSKKQDKSHLLDNSTEIWVYSFLVFGSMPLTKKTAGFPGLNPLRLIKISGNS
jgi:hypothetical protein